MAIEAAFGDNPLFRVGNMALATSDQGGVIIGRMMVAIETVETVTDFSGVSLVVKEHFSGFGLIHQADGGFRFFHRKGGITYNCDEQEPGRHTQDDHAVLLRSHLHKFLTVLKRLVKSFEDEKPRNPSTIKALCFQVFLCGRRTPLLKPGGGLPGFESLRFQPVTGGRKKKRRMAIPANVCTIY